MTILKREQLPLEDIEICLVKGLWKHRHALKINQQQIIAYFSFPHRTVHHNVISAITRNQAGTDDDAFPPTDKSTCETFLNQSNGEWGEHLWATMISGIHPASHRSDFSFTYHYHPVGQGLFCSGSFTRSSHDPFHWVYDCGTDGGSRSPKSAALVTTEIDTLAAEVATDRLDLVTLSHFDEDHLSGMTALLRTFRVGTLLLPYLTPWERLIVALHERVEIGSELLKFLTAPAAYLLEQPEFRIEKILFVPSGGEGPAMPPFLGPTDRPPEDEAVGRAPEIIVKDHPLDQEDKNADGIADAGLADERVRILDHGCWILIGNAWEFVPYNDTALETAATPSFKAKARPLATTLTSSTDAEEREQALDDLTALYDATFKTPNSKKITARRRNLISLFLYAGPIGPVELRRAEATVPRRGARSLSTEIPRFWIPSDRFGQMFTGDGFLQTKKQEKDFLDFFAAGNRVERGAIFQVMHHGSEANWRKAFAGKIKPVASLFCSNPLGKHGHPSGKVLADFANYHPVQVDGVHGWRLTGRYRFR